MSDNKKYLTIHGHFYQPPRENPWLEAIEQQDSAAPYHDWNERINAECYNPNSVSKIVDNHNKIIDLINNYTYISFNFGPTLMSWLENHSPLTYERIIKADSKSIEMYSGHGNAIAQVYNHMIMPLANNHDKDTQVYWGIKDFEYRFGHKPEGMWLAETAVDDETLGVLSDHEIKFTILSPFQAEKFKKINDSTWTDVSWGNIDPARAYRYFIKSRPGKYIDLFFYDGAISKSVAFDELLRDANKFAKRLQDGISSQRDFPQLINIATDGESYGHHTKFGDMALAYLMRIKAEEDNFVITNYGEFLEKFPPENEVIIKQASSWSCFHGVGRWKEDCGCSTGAQPGWNQQWRKPLRNALDYLRDELATLCENEGKKYFNDFWDARNHYIEVILDRSSITINKFLKTYLKKNCTEDKAKVNALKLLEIQRQAMLMYTSCGWFFADISGIETTQIMKYATRCIQLAADFTNNDYETNFLNILSKAQSNIKEFGSGKDIYERFVKPAVVSIGQIACLWAISSLYKEYEKETHIYCYKVKKLNYKRLEKGETSLLVGRIEIQSKITLEKNDLIFTLLQYSGGDFHFAIKEFSDTALLNTIQKNLCTTYLELPLTESIRQIDEYFGKNYYTLKDIFVEERKKTLNILLKDKLSKFKNIYKDLYAQGRGTIYHLQNLDVPIPTEIKIAAQYTLTLEFNQLILECKNEIDELNIQTAIEIKNEAKALNIELDRTVANQIFAHKILKSVLKLSKNLEVHQAENVIELFEYVEKLGLQVNIAEAQNIYYIDIYNELGNILDVQETDEDIKKNYNFIVLLLKIGDKLNINTTFYKEKLDILYTNDKKSSLSN